MNALIAVLTRDGRPSSAEECTSVLLFSREGGGWEVTEEISWHLTQEGELLDIRDQVRSLILELGECRIVMAAQLSGLAYHVFDRMGFAVFEAAELSGGLFDSILEDMEQDRDRKEEQSPTAPERCDDQGRYFLDLIALQENHPEVSSKRALRDFLHSNRNFFELKVVCSHVPPWLEAELPALHLGYRTDKLSNGSLSVTISRRLCNT